MVMISQCVDDKLRQAMTKTIERLGSSVTASAEDFTVFVTLDAAKGRKDRGFTKSLNALSALACGEPHPSFSTGFECEEVRACFALYSTALVS